MAHIYLMHNEIMAYDWGSTTAIAALTGIKPARNGKQAELWMGAHPKAPSKIRVDGGTASLIDVIQSAPDRILGALIAKKFNNQLPYLFKVLAAAEPLSIQAHPNKAQARTGFERENTAGLPLNAFNRNYKDPHHKPECICALTPFWALCGFRHPHAIVDLFDKVIPEGYESLLDELSRSGRGSSLKQFFKKLFELDGPTRDRLILATVAASQQQIQLAAEYRWVAQLAARYPNDPGVLAPLFLNVVQLQPGQALYLPAGELHAYLAGTGIELMANSDNVLRGGLTPKHVDVAELLTVLRFCPRDIELVDRNQPRPFEYVYETPAEEFVLSTICVADGQSYASPPTHSVEILLNVDGRAGLRTGDAKAPLMLAKGRSALVPAAVNQYFIDGPAVIYKAAVPL